MKAELTEMEPKLAAKSIAVAELLKNLTKEQLQADKVRNIVKADEEVAKVRSLYNFRNQRYIGVFFFKEKAAETQALADDAQKDLDTAMPAMEAALKALESLNKNDINELKVFQKPPPLVQFVMESVCLLLGAKYVHI